MASPRWTATPSQFETSLVSFIAADSTRAKIAIREQESQAASGENIPAMYGGFTLLDCLASITGATLDVITYVGKLRSAGGFVTTSSTITRADGGSFITDGWKVGMNVMTFAVDTLTPNASQDGVIGTITTVTGTVLTVNGTPFAALALSADTGIYQVNQLQRTAVAANAGNTNAIPSVAIMFSSMDGSTIRSERKFGEDEVFIVAPSAAVAGLPVVLAITSQYARY